MLHDPMVELLEQRIGVKFRDADLLHKALRHRSADPDHPKNNYERLEFLGDGILGMTICQYLYSHYPDKNEGNLAIAKSYLASDRVFTAIALELGLDEAIELGDLEAISSGRARKRILEDVFEALIAAIYLDQGMRKAQQVARKWLKPYFKEVETTAYRRDFKSMLQESTQKTHHKAPRYQITQETGAEHDKTFYAQVLLGNKILGHGVGKSKKEAEQEAASEALRIIDMEFSEGE